MISFLSLAFFILYSKLSDGSGFRIKQGEHKPMVFYVIEQKGQNEPYVAGSENGSLATSFDMHYLILSSG